MVYAQNPAIIIIINHSAKIKKEKEEKLSMAQMPDYGTVISHSTPEVRPRVALVKQGSPVTSPHS